MRGTQLTFMKCLLGARNHGAPPIHCPCNHDAGPVLIPILQSGKLPKRSEEAAKVT